MDFTSIERQKRTRGGSSETVAVTFERVVRKDPRAPSPEDYAEGFLMNNAFGMQAADAEGNLTNLVRFTRRELEQKGEHAPLDIFDLDRKRGQHQPVKPGGVVILENAYKDNKSGNLVARYLNVAFRDPADGVCHTDLPVYVGPERTSRDTGFVEQDRIVAVTHFAQTFSGTDDFRAKARDALTPSEAIGGTPQAQVRLIVADGDGGFKVYSHTIYSKWDKAANGYMDPLASVDDFLARNEGWAGNIAMSDDPKNSHVYCEVLPQVQYRTGKDSLPSHQKPGRILDHSNFRFAPRDENGEFLRKDSNGEQIFFQGYAAGILVVRSGSTPEGGQKWYATNTFRQDRNSPIYDRDAIPTVSMPDDMRAHFERVGAERTKDFAESMKSKRAASNAASNDVDEDIPFGAPSPSGMTPS